ncbi:MAG: ABC transporter ATP-binding protein [Cellvibrio sp.]|uniref:ABC transporter ATP-binding protein n=1 Tax=Cellvibrio sp. TaxID=1965322 RepID=UPI0031AC0EDC
MLSIKGLSFGYPRQPVHLDGLTLDVARGDILGLLGPNGAGKTTLVSLIAGLLKPAAGSIQLAGEPAALGRRELALVPQEYAFYLRLTGRENLDYFAAVCHSNPQTRRAAVERAIEETGLGELQHQLAARYSGGFKRRLNIAIALLQAPELLILDEPTANVDPQSRAFLLDVVRRLNQSGTTIIYTSHLLDEVEDLCRSVAVMDRGRILLQGDMKSLLAEQHCLHLALPSAPPAALLAQAGVVKRDESPSAQEWEFDLDRLGISAAQLLLQLEQAGITPIQIHYGQRRLESVFLTALARENERL